MCCASPIEKDLTFCFLATSLPTQSTSSSPCSRPPHRHASWGFCEPLLLPVLAVCSREAASSWGLRGWGWHATFALHHTAPLWLNLHCKPVRPLPKSSCCPPHEEVCRVSTALDMGLQAIHPQNSQWLVPIEYVCRFISMSISLILGARGEHLSFYFGALYLKIYSAIERYETLYAI